MDAVAGDGGGDRGRRGVLGDVVGFEPGDDDVGDTGRFERGGLGRADQRAFFENQAAMADGVDGSAADRGSGRDRTELHDTARTAPARAALPASVASAAAAARRGLLTQPRRDLGDDRDRDLRRRYRADIKPDRRMDAGDVGLGKALALEPFDAAGVGFARPERADIETVARQRMSERRIVDLGIVGERDERGVAVDAERRQRLVRPFGDRP